MGQDERLLLGSSFGAAATAYAEHRPDYAQAAVHWALERAPGSRVLDLGAGTGKLTATLVSLGAEVIAVEPDPAMLAELRRALPTVRALSGSAEAVPLPDASVDAVLAGNAMHWFDMNVAGPSSPESSNQTASWPACGTSSTTGSTGLPHSNGSAGRRPLARGTRSAAGAPRRPKRTSQTVARSPSSARRSRPSSRTGSHGPPIPSSRRSRRRRGCWSCQNRNERPRSVGSALSSRADRRPLAANSPCRC